MSLYLNVKAEDLQLEDRVKGRGKVIRDVVDHETREGFVTVIFERRGEESIAIIPSDHVMLVRCADED